MFLLFLVLFPHIEAGEEETYLPQGPHGDRQQGLGEDIGRGQQHADHEDPDDDVGALLPQALGGGDPGPAEQYGGHRYLERHPEREEQGQHEVQIAGNVGRHRHPGGGRAGEEAEHQGEHHVVGERHAGIEEHGTGGHQRHDETPLVLVQAGGDEGPGLIEQIGDGHEEGDHQGQLDGRDEGGRHIRRYHAGPFRQLAEQRPGHEIVDVVGEIDERDKRQQDGRDGTQQTGSQLHQVADKGLLGLTHGFTSPLPADSLTGSRWLLTGGTSRVSCTTGSTGVAGSTWATGGRISFCASCCG